MTEAGDLGILALNGVFFSVILDLLQKLKLLQSLVPHSFPEGEQLGPDRLQESFVLLKWDLRELLLGGLLLP